MKVREVMTENPKTCNPSTDLRRVAEMMREADVGAIPVVGEDGKKPAGIVTDRDIVVRVVANGDNPAQMRVSDAWTQQVVTVGSDDSVDEAARLMEQNQVRRIVVVDGDQIRGIVAQADLARAAEDTAGEVVQEVSQPSGDASKAAGT